MHSWMESQKGEKLLFVPRVVSWLVLEWVRLIFQVLGFTALPKNQMGIPDEKN